MDYKSYASEIQKLQREVGSLDGVNKAVEPVKPGLAGLMRYKPYVLIGLLCLVFLLLVRPRIVLKIALVKTVPTIVVDKVKFAIWWMVLTALLCGGYYGYFRLRKT